MSKGLMIGCGVAGALLMTGCLSLTAEAKVHAPALKDLIAGYRSWRKVNEKPIYMQPQISALCRGPMPWEGRNNPHNPRYFTVYVNKAGTKAMLQEGPPSFPAGSVIVKEKLPSAKATQPELLTIMVKKEPGFDSAHGDWQYFTADGSGQLVSQENVAKCQSCHEANKGQDYVFRNYR